MTPLSAAMLGFGAGFFVGVFFAALMVVLELRKIKREKEG